MTTDPYVLPRATAAGGSPSTAPDDDLVAQAKAGPDRMDAWARLYQEYHTRIYRHVRFLVGNDAATEDVVQEVFARALVSLHAFDGRSSFSTWLHGIAVNVVRNHWRSHRNTETAHQRLRDIVVARGGAHEIDRAHLCRRRAEVVYALLEDLPEHLREAFVLRDLEGFSPAEAATQLGITAGNLSVRVTRARERIRRELERIGWLAPRDGDDGGTP
jgi:RNA polymerase sigma-70 factor (ECF subfamily)